MFSLNPGAFVACIVSLHSVLHISAVLCILGHLLLGLSEYACIILFYNTILIVDTCSTNVYFAIYLQKDAIHKFLDDSIACRITKAVNEI